MVPVWVGSFEHEAGVGHCAVNTSLTAHNPAGASCGGRWAASWDTPCWWTWSLPFPRWNTGGEAATLLTVVCVGLVETGGAVAAESAGGRGVAE